MSPDEQLHIFDAFARPKGRKPILGREVWFAYCSCGWVSKVAAATVEVAAIDHRLHRARVLGAFRRWAQ